MKRLLFASLILVVCLLAGPATLGQEAPPRRAAPDPKAPAPKAPDPGYSGLKLIEGLKKTEGCLGVDAGQWMSGKRTIIAWFKDKKAVLRWYYSEEHQEAMTLFTEGAEKHKPLAHVPDDGKPIMVMATLTLAKKPAFEGLNLPVSQISIELFAPLPGGAHAGGRLAPPTFEVPHMRDYTPPAEAKEKKAPAPPEN